MAICQNCSPHKKWPIDYRFILKQSVNGQKKEDSKVVSLETEFDVPFDIENQILKSG